MAYEDVKFYPTSPLREQRGEREGNGEADRRRQDMYHIREGSRNNVEMAWW